MPRIPEGMEEYGWDLEAPGTRFVSRPAVAIPIPETDWETYEGKPVEALRDGVGDWLLDEEQEGLGRGEAVNGSAGRGADAWIPVLEFIGLHAAGGVVSTAAGMAFKRVWQRVSDALRQRGTKPDVSRGGAAALAVAHVAEKFDAQDPVEVEAAEEPRSIAGGDLTELSYVGVEPWIVLLLSREQGKRYVVVVDPHGEILGSLETELSEFEPMFMPPVEESPGS